MESQSDMGKADGKKKTVRYTGNKKTEGTAGKKKTERYTGNKKTEGYAGKEKTERYTGKKKAESYAGKEKTVRYTGNKKTEGYAGKEKTERYTGNKKAEGYAGKEKAERYTGNKKAEGYAGKEKTERYTGKKKTESYTKKEKAESCTGKKEISNNKIKRNRADRPSVMQKNISHGNKHTNSRQSELCPSARLCGGCRWIGEAYETQLKYKEEKIKQLLSPFCRLEKMIGMDNPYHYRNKVHAVFGEDYRHNPISGIYEEGTHNIVPIDSCLIENQKADEIIVSIRGLLKSFKIRPYQEDTGYGLLRHVLIRTGHVTGEIMVVLVLSSPILPSRNNFVKALLKLHPEITTIVQNVNDRNTNMVLGSREQVLYGRGYIEDVLCGKTFRISPRSFYQVNPAQTERLYAKALEYAALKGDETVLDAYCGTGTIGIIASSQAGQVIGVELNKDAVKDAIENAKRNQVKNIRFYQNDAGLFMEEMAGQQAKVDVVFMDPPRSGSNEAFLSAVVKLKPKKVVYISCSPETLVRDMGYLKMNGYKGVKGVGVDMFPFTEACEVCVELNR